jgi:hypothetical protein
MNWSMTSLVQLHWPFHLSQAQTAPYLGPLTRIGTETARRSPELERRWCTLPCPTWRHDVASPLVLHHSALWTRKAPMCCDGLRRFAPELLFPHTYASYINQPCIRLFFAWCATIDFVVVGADRTIAYADSPSPTEATAVRLTMPTSAWGS